MADKKENLHDGHRKRMQSRFLQTGFQSFSEHEILEYLLFYVIPRRDTNEMGHVLLDTFGSLEHVLQASYEELKNIQGIGEKTAGFIFFLQELYKAYLNSRYRDISLRSFESRKVFFLQRLMAEPVEMMLLACLDDRMHLCSCYTLAVGTTNHVDVHTAELLLRSLNAHCSQVILAHNHPGGRAVFSLQDMQTTAMLNDLFKKLNIRLVDHVLVAESTAVSMAQTHPESLL